MMTSIAFEADPQPGQLRARALRADLESYLTCHAAPEPFALTPGQVEWFRNLGPCLLSFYQAKDRLYRLSVEGQAPGWVARYLDNGKPEAIVALGRAQAFRNQLPAIIRPDVLLSPNGYTICELDSVPGGFGLAARLADSYRHEGFAVAGDTSIEAGFIEAMRGSRSAGTGATAILVSDESADYRGEMDWLAAKLRGAGYPVYAVHPRDLEYSEKGISMTVGDDQAVIDVVYRFAELFDLPNVSKSELLLYLAKSKRIFLTSPPKAYLEEKMWFAFFCHPSLQGYWRNALGTEQLELLREVLPQTWIVDPTPLPGQGVIPALSIDGRAVQDWTTVQGARKSERRLVVKPSGFSELAWGSRGVVVGHDVSSAEWSNAIGRAQASYPSPTWVLQEYISPARHSVTRYDLAGGTLTFDGRVRLNPFYFVVAGEAKLSSILATICSSEKKKIHGMKDAVMTICSDVQPSLQTT